MAHPVDFDIPRPSSGCDTRVFASALLGRTSFTLLNPILGGPADRQAVRRLAQRGSCATPPYEPGQKRSDCRQDVFIHRDRSLHGRRLTNKNYRSRS